MALLCGITNLIYLLNKGALCFNPFNVKISSIYVRSNNYLSQVEHLIKNIYF